MNKLTQHWANGVLKFRALILLFTLVAMMCAPLSFNRLYHDDSNESYFIENDPNLESFNKLIELFGDNEYLLVGVPAREGDNDVFQAETIKMIAELTEFLENHRHVSQVRSLSKYEYTHDDNGIMSTDDLFEDVEALADSPQELAEARQIMSEEELALETLITQDMCHTQIAARTTYIRGENTHKVEVVTELINFIKEKGYEQKGYDLHLSGISVVSERFETLTQRDMAWINPVMTVIMIAILFAIFRSAVATLVPMLVIGTTVLLTIGLQGWLRWPFTAVNSALIPTVIILCVGASIHVLVEFYRFRVDGEDPIEAAKSTIKDLLFPVFFTCLTTAVGFATLSITELSPVRQFALLAAASAMMIFIISMVALPALLSYVPWIAKGNRSHKNSNNWIILGLKKLPKLTSKHRKIIAGLGISLAAFSVFSTSFISVDTNIVNYFKKDSWFAKDLNYFNEHFKGISNLEIIVDSGEENGIHSPEFLQRVDELQSYIESHESSGKALSLLRFHKQINQSLNYDNPEYFSLPTSRDMAAQFLFLYENTGPEEDLSDLKDFDERYLRLAVPFKNMDAKDMTKELNAIRQDLNNQFSDLDIEITGGMVMNNAQNNYVNTGMFRSFGIAILVIGISFIFLFRSIKYGIIALVPSVVPVLLTGGLISLAGVSLDLGTMIVGAMTIGIAVDDSIHLMSRYLLRRKQGLDVHQSISGALATTGKAVILTSIILVCGFSVMLLGSFVSYIYVGLFSAMIMTFALIGDLFFMPALLYLFDQSPDERLKHYRASNEEAVSHA